MTCNPYTKTSCETTPPQPEETDDAVCGHKFSDTACTKYEIIDYASEKAALADGAVVTHYGVCGACSTRQDLGVYMKYFDMTSVGKECGIKTGILTAYGIRCFEDLGMTTPCASIWAYNAKYDSDVC